MVVHSKKLVSFMLLCACASLIVPLNGFAKEAVKPLDEGSKKYLTEILHEVYVDACAREVREHVQALDTLDEKIDALLQKLKASDSLLGPVSALRENSDEIAKKYEALKLVPVKYNYWLETTFSNQERHNAYRVPHSVIRVKRWEAIRPAILLSPVFVDKEEELAEPGLNTIPKYLYALETNIPETPGVNESPTSKEGETQRDKSDEDLTSLGWDTPEKDRDAWKSARNRRFEFLYLLVHLASENGGSEFAETETGIQHLKEFQASSQWGGEGCRFFHGEYRYAPLTSPALDELPSRVRFACNQLASSEALEMPLIDFIREKDAFIFDLLRLALNGEKVYKPAFQWAVTSARWHPFLTRMLPEQTSDEQVRIISPRNNRREDGFTTLTEFEKIEQLVKRTCSPDFQTDFSDAVYCYQMEEMGWEPHSWIPPVNGWSGWLAKNEDCVAENHELVFDEIEENESPEPPYEKANTIITSPERAWTEICAWLRSQASDKDIFYELTNNTQWSFAFSTRSLNKGNEENKRRFPVCKVRLAAVEETKEENDRKLLLQIEMEPGSISTKRFLIEGAWPAWFACKRPGWGLRIAVFLLFAGSAVGACFSTWIIVSGDGATHKVLVALTTCLALSVGALTATLLLFPPCMPEACPSAEIGGVIEFGLPSSANLSEGLSETAREVCTEFYAALINRMGSEFQSEDIKHRCNSRPYEFSRRWIEAISELKQAVRFFPKSANRSVPGGNICLSRLHYRLAPTCFGATPPTALGLVTEQNFSKFVEGVDSCLGWGKSHRLAPPITLPEPALSSTFLKGPAKNVRFSLQITNGDHGRLTVPDTPIPKHDTTIIYTLLLPEPSRDPVQNRGLGLDFISHWLTDRSDIMSSVFSEGIEEDSLICSAPTEMDKHRERFWAERMKSKQQWRGKVEVAVSHVLQSFLASADWGSQSVLGVGPRAFLFLLLVFFIAPLLALRSNVMKWYKYFFRAFILIAGILFCTAFLYVIIGPDIWTYSPRFLTAMNCAFWISILLALTSALLAWVFDRKSHDHLKRVIPARRSEQAYWETALRLFSCIVLASFSLLFLSMAITAWTVVPVWTEDSFAFLPKSYTHTVCDGLFFWILAVLLFGIDLNAIHKRIRT